MSWKGIIKMLGSLIAVNMAWKGHVPARTGCQNVILRCLIAI
jgi:hypothetical protein